jgi:hypothetical protein
MAVLTRTDFFTVSTINPHFLKVSVNSGTEMANFTEKVIFRQ